MRKNGILLLGEELRDEFTALFKSMSALYDKIPQGAQERDVAKYADKLSQLLSEAAVRRWIERVNSIIEELHYTPNLPTDDPLFKHMIAIMKELSNMIIRLRRFAVLAQKNNYGYAVKEWKIETPLELFATLANTANAFCQEYSARVNQTNRQLAA
jgi:hypothetical protein